MEEQAGRQRRDDPWYRRLIPAFIGVGAVASAFLAIDQAKDVLFDSGPARQRASLSLEEVGPQALSDFAAERDNVDLPPGDRGEASSTFRSRSVTVVVEQVSARTTLAPTPLPSLDGGDVPLPSTTATTATTDPAEESTGPDPPTGSDTPSESNSSPTPPGTKEAVGELATARQILRRPDLEAYDLEPEDLVQLLPPDQPVADTGAVPTEVGRPTPKQSARRLARAFSHVETISSGGGLSRDGKRQPLGFVISVDFILEGFKGDDVQLTWFLLGDRIPKEFRASMKGYRLDAATDDYGRSVRLWVPDLKRPGPYRVIVSLSEGERPYGMLSDDAHRIANK